MHGIYVGELQALEGAGRSLWDFPDAPWEFKMNMARQCWDEARHVQIYEKLLEHVGGDAGHVPREHVPVRVRLLRRPGAARGRREPRPRGPRLRRVPRHDPLRRADRRREDAAGGRLRARRRAHPRALRQRLGARVHARTTRSASSARRSSASRSTSSSASAARARTARTPRSRSRARIAARRASPRRS